VLLAAIVLAAACSSGRTVTASTPPRTLSGYDAVVLRVTDSGGAVHEWCVLVAATDAQRQHGLMDVDSLGGYDGMLFRFDAPSSDAFYMYRTRIPLSVAFFDAAGAFVSAADMAPCTSADSTACPLYRATAPYLDAVEAPAGTLPRLGIGPGAAMAIGAACQR
jgi:uncharacterized membrane protein (UPF0127 family)